MIVSFKRMLLFLAILALVIEVVLSTRVTACDGDCPDVIECCESFHFIDGACQGTEAYCYSASEKAASPQA